MANKYDFLAPPKPHHHAYRLIVLLVIIAAILFLGWLYSGIVNMSNDASGRFGSSKESGTSNDGAISEKSRAEIIQSLQSAPPSNVSAETRAAIMVQFQNSTDAAPQTRRSGTSEVFQTEI